MKIKKNIKITFFIFLSLIYFCLLTILVIFLIEITKFGTKLSNKINELEIHNTSYYGEKLNYNPYKKFDNKFLHPYLTFSMPWSDEEIKKINNTYVSLNSQGLRNNPYNKETNSYAGVILGGSTAFGYYASSDKTTIASLISQQLNINFHNLNGPSWNSHQELISLIKFKEKFDLSISFTGNNDFSIFCHRTKGTNLEENYIDAVERFDDINKVFRSIIDKQLYHLTFKTFLKYLVINTVPETLKTINYIKHNFNKKKTIKPIQSIGLSSKCITKNGDFDKKNLQRSINQFISNQQTIRAITEMKGAVHYLILQPQYYKDSKSPTKEMYKYIYNEVMNSDLCKKNCYNFQNIFQENRSLSYMENLSGEYNNELFIDNIHLSDMGNQIVSKKLIEIIRSKNLYNE